MERDERPPWSGVLRWAYGVMSRDPVFLDVTHDAAFDRVSFTVPGARGVRRRYRLTLELGRPVVEQVDGPPEAQ